MIVYLDLISVKFDTIFHLKSRSLPAAKFIHLSAIIAYFTSYHKGKELNDGFQLTTQALVIVGYGNC